MDTLIYCDESCHLEHDQSNVMVLGAVHCDKELSRKFSDEIRGIKAKHGLKLPDASSRGFEIKWTKVGPSKLAFYKELLHWFLDTDGINARVLIVPEKQALDHGSRGQSHDDFYYKMYYQLLLRLLDSKNHSYSVYLDVKDTNGSPKTKMLHDYLCNKMYDFNHEVLRRVDQIRSDESEILQICDLIIGAIGYHNRGLESSSAKTELVSVLRTHSRPSFSPRSLTSTSYLSEKKLNVLYWRPREQK